MLQVVQQRELGGDLSRHETLTQVQLVGHTLGHVNLDSILSTHFQQLLNAPLELLLQLFHILAENPLPFTFVDGTSPFQPPLHGSPRSRNKINDHQHISLMQMILGRAQFHPVLVHHPHPRAMMRRRRIHQRVQPPRRDFRETLSDRIAVQIPHPRGRDSGWRGGRRGHVRFVLGDERHGNRHGDDDDADEAAPHHERAPIDEVPNGPSLQFLVGRGPLGDAIVVHVHHLGVHLGQFFRPGQFHLVVMGIVGVHIVVILFGPGAPPILASASVEIFVRDAHADVAKITGGGPPTVAHHVPGLDFATLVLGAKGLLALVLGAAALGFLLIVPPLGFGGVDGGGGDGIAVATASTAGGPSSGSGTGPTAGGLAVAAVVRGGGLSSRSRAPTAAVSAGGAGVGRG
mmetsp:Transcript_23796/g.40685  ORF Transcript_23796/g.40685 Transcript_23796/m.40685 type:complete len:402 (+) Transcript_23796:396-1601(+)